MKFIDLTLPLYNGMPVYPGDQEALIETVMTLDKDGWNMLRMHLNLHDGTHVNVPLHAVDKGKDLDDYELADFCGQAVIYDPSQPMDGSKGVIFRDHDINIEIGEEIKRVMPRFIGLSATYEFDIEIEKDLLRAGIVSFEKLTNLELLPQEFMFYGMPLKIKKGDGSPVRAIAII